MEQLKTLLFVRAENNGVFDGSFLGTPITMNGSITHSTKEDEFLITKGFINMGRIPGLETSGAFTLEAVITPEAVTGSRQNIMESQSPPAALFIDNKGLLTGSVHVKGTGWQSLAAKTPLAAGKAYRVRFSRDAGGKMTLEVNDKSVATSKTTGALEPVGQLGFRAGAGMDGKAYQFKGKIGNITIREGAFTATAWNKRVRDAKILETSIKNKIGAGALVSVIASLDESRAHLQPIKEIMNAAGVEKISDLSTLQVKVPTAIPKGKLLVAPRKSRIIDVNWGNIAGGFKALTAAQKKEQLARYLPNRNSSAVLKAAATVTHPAPGPITPVNTIGATGLSGRLDHLTILNRTGVRLPKDVIRNSPTLAAFRPGVSLSEVVQLSGTGLRLNNKETFLQQIAARKPEAWPMLTQPPKPIKMVTLPIGASVIIAGVLDLTNTQLVIEPDVEKLYIIAERVICGPNATITWRRPGGSTPPRLNDDGLNGQGWNGIHTKHDSRDGLDGSNGQPGSEGIPGAGGRNAPALEMWVKDLTNIPNLDLNGEDGIKGGAGQRGGRGGDGADGAGGKRIWVFGWHCVSDPGDGGDGGNGGRGGDGGRGGNGGAGGNITIGVLDGTLASTVTNNAFRLKNQGGQRGRGGAGGEGGNGGIGGRSGNGETCKDGRNGHNGSKGQPGATGPDASLAGRDAENRFFQFSEDAWEELLTRPFVTEINPSEVFPGNKITLRGTQFANNDRVVIEGVATLVPTINADESISVNVPLNISGGQKSVYVRRASDGTESNRVPIRVKPQLDTLPASLPPNADVTITGKAFLTGASVLINGAAIPASSVTATQVVFRMPGTGGTGSSGGTVNVAVRNPDGLVSNTRTASKPRILEIPFTFGANNLPFKNPTDGVPDWGTFEDTFGTAEVWHELLDPLFGHPVLTGAFYIFYEHFLKGTANGGLATGFCTSMASFVADKLWKGENDAVTFSKASIHKMLTAIHGKLLSRESLIHFHDQSRQEIARVEKTAREIEKVFLTGCDRNVAPLLFFIPSGAVWDAGYIDGLSSSHCLMPYRFVYPEGHPGPKLSADGSTTTASLNGVELYCWDCNHQDDPNCRIKFRMDGGVLHYDYFDGGTDIQFSSSDNITLGQMSNGDYLLADHDLPFSGPFGLTSFIIDFLLSPADLEILDENGLRVGRFNNSIYSEVPDSHPCYLVPGAYLLPVDRSYTRHIVGNGSGTYTFNSIMPDGTTIKLENVATQPGHRDTLMMNADASQVRFAPHAEKEFTVTFSKLVGNQVRSLAISGVGGGPATEADITVAPDLSLFRLGNRSSLKNVEVKAFSVNKTANTPVNKKVSLQLPVNHDLVVSVSDWNTVDLQAETLGF
ncbi:IPT/TIG domain-containing protein [Chitinophaga sp.]|uniref:IPT/TIG domain-containing protein n=1 Tax=Chitinophaga sp. TaxID=1869181 RepID=UPI0031D170D7